MPVIEPLANKRLRRSKSNDSAELRYIITDAPSQIVAHNTLEAIAPATVVSNSKLLYLESTDTEPDDESETTFYGTANYVERVRREMQETPQTGDSEFAFDVTGQTFRLMNSYGTLRYSAAGGVGATDIPDFKGAINVQDDRVEGVEIVIPQARYTETHYLPAGQITNNYVDALSQVVGKLNAGSFRGYTAERLLLLGVSGSKRGAEDWRVSFSWALGSHEASLTIGGIGGVSKLAHDYLWVLYDIEEDTTAKRLKKTPVGVYVEKVYRTANYGLLGIGS